MSIWIGERNLPTSTKERIFVQSDVESNLLILKSFLSNTNMILADYSLGQRSDRFVLSQSNQVSPLFSINSNLSQITVPLTVTESVVVSSNATVAGDLSTTRLQTKAIEGLDDSGDITMSFNGNTGRLLLGRAGSSIGIGTTFARQSIHTESNIYVGSNLYASFIYSALPNDNRFIRFNPANININGNTVVTGTFRATAGIDFGDTVSASNVNVFRALTTPFADIQSSDPSSNLLRIRYTGPMTDAVADSNLLDVVLRPEDSNVHALCISRAGRIGIGTDRPTTIIDIRKTANHDLGGLSNILQFIGDSPYDRFVIDNAANVGLGTNAPGHALHVVGAEHSNTATVGIYGAYSSPALETLGCNLPPLLHAYSNATLVAGINSHGGIFLGAGANSNSPDNMLEVMGDGYIDCLTTTCLVAPRTAGLGCNIDFLNSGLRGLSNVQTTALQTGRMEVQDLVANYMFTSNWEIIGMQCFDSNTYGLSEFHIRTSNLLFTGKQVHFDETLEDIIDRDEDPLTQGKVKVKVRNSTSTGISRGLTITGNVNASTLVRTLDATHVPSYEMRNPNLSAQMGLQAAGGVNSVILRFGSASNADNPLYNAGTTVLEARQTGEIALSSSKGCVVAPTGFVGIGLTEAAAHAIDIRGNLRIRSTANPITQTLFARADLQRVGIATDSPTQTLHVQGTFYASNEALMGSKVTVGATNHNNTDSNMLTVWSPTAPAPAVPGLLVSRNGNVGIGTTLPRFTLDVGGDLNFNGTLFQNGAQYISSQWTTTNTTDIYYSTGNVGIGTTTPNQKLAVNGNIFASGSFMSTSDRSVKTDLALITDPLTKINALTGYTFTKTDGSRRRETGLIAQDVAAVLPEAVFAQGDGTLSIAYGNMAGLFAEAIKSLNAELAAVTTELAAVTTELAAVRTELAAVTTELAAVRAELAAARI